MSTKPSDTVRFARTAGGVDSSHITTPSAGLRDNGYGTNAIPTSGDFDYLLNQYGKWFQYLSDGNLTGAHTFGSTVGITGDLTVGGTTSLQTVNAASAVVSGSGSFAGGLTTATSAVTCGAVTASGVITANAGVAGGTNQHVTVSGTGKFKHPTITDVQSPFGAFAGNVNSPVIAMGASNELLQLSGAFAGAFCVIPLRLQVGWNVTAIRVRLLDNATGPTKIATQVAKVIDGAITLIMAGGLSSGTGVFQTVSTSSTAQSFVVAAGTAYHVRLALSGNANICSINHIEIDYDQP